jgi:hypothetical protein
MRLWVLRIRGEFKNYSFICAHVPMEEKSEKQKVRWYETKDDVHAVPLIRNKHYVKLGMEILTGTAVGT